MNENRPRSWTDEQFIVAAQSARSIAEVLRQLNLSPVGGNYQTVIRHAKRLGQSLDHMAGQSWNKGRSPVVIYPLEIILVENSSYTSTSNLKKRLLKEGVLVEQCSICGSSPEWQGTPLVMELDHINGVRNDNRIENLRLLCPNCHSQTSTFRGRNVKTKAN